MTDQYNQNTMGYGSGSEITGVYHGTRGWSVPNLVGYMESHDEERLMYKNLQFGNSGTGYNVKTLATALKRVEAASLMFYTIMALKCCGSLVNWVLSIALIDVKADSLTHPVPKEVMVIADCLLNQPCGSIRMSTHAGNYLITQQT